MGALLDVLIAMVAAAAVPLLRILSRPSRRLVRTRRVLDYFGLAVIQHHYYSPMVTPSDLIAPLDIPRRLPGLDLNIPEQLALLRSFHYRDELAQIPIDRTSPESFAFYNSSFGSEDAEIFYSIIRHFKPKRIVEIGCGQSTLIARLAEAKNRAEDAGNTCEHICVEPYENSWLEKTGATIIRERIEQLDTTRIEALEQNDILFIDSSHVIRPQGDVLHEFLCLLPLLKPGVLVHVHDIFTPRDYPGRWVLDDRRLWNEQYLLEGFLSFNSEFKILLAANFLSHDYREQLAEVCPLLSDGHNREPGSFWLQRKPLRSEI